MTKQPRKTVCVYRPEKRRGNPRLTNLLADAVSPPRPQSRQIPSNFFDAMPLRIQAAFWLGAIRSKLLPIRSLVYSGGKSIHGLLRLKDDEPFAAQWRLLERTLADDADPTYRCDLACRNSGRMTRFPGALRPETGKRQALLYLAC